MFNSKSREDKLNEARVDALNAMKNLENGLGSLENIFNSEVFLSLKSPYIKDRINKAQVLINLGITQLKSAKSKLPRD